MMKVTFDSNAWQPVVVPHRFPNHPHKDAVNRIHHAIKNGLVKGFISETVATLEGVPRKSRPSFMKDWDLNLEIVGERCTDNHVHMQVKLAGGKGHPGIAPILADRLNAAFSLGFQMLPSSRMGMARPAEIDREDVRIPLTASQRENIWELLQTIEDITDAIEARGVGRAKIVAIANRIQKRLGIDDPNHWRDGLGHPQDDAEKTEIMNAIAEWADGDSVALHIVYGLDLFCTSDEGKGAGKSIFDPHNRSWLAGTYGVRFGTLGDLASLLSGVR